MLSFLESLGIRFVNKIEELYTQGAKECLEPTQIHFIKKPKAIFLNNPNLRKHF